MHKSTKAILAALVLVVLASGAWILFRDGSVEQPRVVIEVDGEVYASYDLDEVKGILGIESGEVTKDGKFSIQDTRCLGCCGLAPVMTVNSDVYGRITPEDVKGILEKY